MLSVEAREQLVEALGITEGPLEESMEAEASIDIGERENEGEIEADEEKE